MFKIFKTAEEKKAIKQAKEKKISDNRVFICVHQANVEKLCGELLYLSRLRGEYIEQNSRNGVESGRADDVLESIDSAIKYLCEQINEREYLYVDKKKKEKIIQKLYEKKVAEMFRS